MTSLANNNKNINETVSYKQEYPLNFKGHLSKRHSLHKTTIHLTNNNNDDLKNSKFIYKRQISQNTTILLRSTMNQNNDTSIGCSTVVVMIEAHNKNGKIK